jgi:hypothetical protein
MRWHATILATLCALLGIGTASATAADAASGASVAKPAGYSIVSATFSLPAGRQTSGQVTCPVKNGAHTVPFSGGALIQTDNVVVNINSSYPTSDGWAAAVNNPTTASQFTVYAVCAKQPAGYELRSKTIPNPADTQTSTSVVCPKGRFLLGGGSLSSSSVLLTNLNSSSPGSSNAWFVTMNNPTTPSASVTAFAICAKLSLAKIEYQIIAPAGVDNPAGHEAASDATCPTGLSVRWREPVEWWARCQHQLELSFHRRMDRRREQCRHD